MMESSTSTFFSEFSLSGAGAGGHRAMFPSPCSSSSSGDSVTHSHSSASSDDGGDGHSHSSHGDGIMEMDAHFHFSTTPSSIFNNFCPHDELGVNTDIFDRRRGDEDSMSMDQMDLLLPEMTDFSKLLEEGDLGLDIPLLHDQDQLIPQAQSGDQNQLLLQPLLLLSDGITSSCSSSSTSGGGGRVGGTSPGSACDSGGGSGSGSPTPTEADIEQFQYVQLEQHCQNQNNQVHFSYEAYSPKGSPSMMDSPPLTPPEVKIEVGENAQTFIINASNILSVENLPKLLPVLKSGNKRGRSASHDDSPDVQALKRHIRMIRNRESASLSRKKKKEYVTALESRIHSLEKEVDVLRRENKALRTRLHQNQQQETATATVTGDVKLLSGKASGSTPTSTSKSGRGATTTKKSAKAKLTVAGKVALLGLACFLISFHPTTRRVVVPQEQSNYTDFSRTLTFDNLEKLEKIPLLSTVARSRRWTSDVELDVDGDENPRLLNITSWESLEAKNSSSSNLNNTSSASASNSTPNELRNRTLYDTQKSSKNKVPPSRNSSSSTNTWRSRGRGRRNQSKNKTDSGSHSTSGSTPTLAFSSARSLFNSASLIFPKFGVPFSFSGSGVGNSTSNGGGKSQEIANAKCPNSFNKTESMRVQNDLEGIFGKMPLRFSSGFGGGFTDGNVNLNKKLRREREKDPRKMNMKEKKKQMQKKVNGDGEETVYPLVSASARNSEENSIYGPNSDPDFSRGLTVYEGVGTGAGVGDGVDVPIKSGKVHSGSYSSILEKLELSRREDTFYVVSLASDSQLLLSAKAANESSRPKMTFLLPWRNETLKEDMILQIDCEVFQVFNLNSLSHEQKQKKKTQKTGNTNGDGKETPPAPAQVNLNLKAATGRRQGQGQIPTPVTSASHNQNQSQRERARQPQVVALKK